jgi:hypothetical protein
MTSPAFAPGQPSAGLSACRLACGGEQPVLDAVEDAHQQGT